MIDENMYIIIQLCMSYISSKSLTHLFLILYFISFKMSLFYTLYKYHCEFYNNILQTSADATSLDNGNPQSNTRTKTILYGVCGSLAFVLAAASGTICYIWQKKTKAR